MANGITRYSLHLEIVQLIFGQLLSEKQLDDLYEEMFSNDKARGRKKCLVVYLRAKGRPCHESADIARVDKDTVTNTVKKIRRGRLGRFVKRTLP
jgi:hypothetical protein